MNKSCTDQFQHSSNKEVNLGTCVDLFTRATGALLYMFVTGSIFFIRYLLFQSVGPVKYLR